MNITSLYIDIVPVGREVVKHCPPAWAGKICGGAGKI